jgi:hypothetical protein
MSNPNRGTHIESPCARRSPFRPFPNSDLTIPYSRERFPVRRKIFPVSIFREFARNWFENGRVFEVGLHPKRPKIENSPLFSLLAGNSTLGDRFRRTTSATR